MPIDGKITNDGTVTMTWNCQTDQLRSPDGAQQYFPCERCGRPSWVATNVVSFLCDTCASAVGQDLEDLGPAVAAGEISEADAIARIVGPRPY